MPDEYRIGRLRGKFAVSWWVDGKRKRHSLEALTRKEAEGEALDVIARETVKAKPDGLLVRDLWEMYRAEKDGRRVAVAMKHEWKTVGPHFGHLRPDQVSIDTARAYTKKRRATLISRGKDKPPSAVGDGSIWTELGHLRTVFIWAANKKHLITKAPDIERPSKPKSKDRWLTDSEIERLYAAKAAPHILLAIRIMLSTAARVGAVLDLTWDRVDFVNGIVNLQLDGPGTRKGRAVVPMNAGLRAALKVAESAALSEFVIEWAGEQVKSIKTGFNAAVRDAGLTGVSPHVLRHTAAVHMAAAGRPMSRIAQFLGHTSTAVTERVYARFAPEHLQEEADILDFGNKPRLVRTKDEA